MTWLLSAACNGLEVWTPRTVLHGRRKFRRKLGSGGLQRWTSTSIVLGPKSLDEVWGQDRAV